MFCLRMLLFSICRVFELGNNDYLYLFELLDFREFKIDKGYPTSCPSVFLFGKFCNEVVRF